MLFGQLAVFVVARGEGDDLSEIELGTCIVSAQTDGFFEIVTGHGEQVVINGDDAVVSLEGGHDEVELAA